MEKETVAIVVVVEEIVESDGVFFLFTMVLAERSGLRWRG